MGKQCFSINKYSNNSKKLHSQSGVTPELPPWWGPSYWWWFQDPACHSHHYQRWTVYHQRSPRHCVWIRRTATIEKLRLHTNKKRFEVLCNLITVNENYEFFSVNVKFDGSFNWGVPCFINVRCTHILILVLCWKWENHKCMQGFYSYLNYFFPLQGLYLSWSSLSVTVPMT